MIQKVAHRKLLSPAGEQRGIMVIPQAFRRAVELQEQLTKFFQSEHYAAAPSSFPTTAKVLPCSARRFNSGAGSQISPCCRWNSRTRSYTRFSPTVSAYHIGPPR